MALKMAKMEAELGVQSSYYFRKKTFSPEIACKIDSLGHEVGYHYEDWSSCKGNNDKAFASFVSNLSLFRKYVSVETAVMHGSPFSRFNNLDMWKKHNINEFGIVGEPYLYFKGKKDFYYFTDTARTWNGGMFNVRDFINSKTEALIPKVKSSNNLIRFFTENEDVSIVMLTVHPQRWTNNIVIWIIEYFTQSLKNIVKCLLKK
jgi:hypothetical protein